MCLIMVVEIPIGRLGIPDEIVVWMVKTGCDEQGYWSGWRDVCAVVGN